MLQELEGGYLWGHLFCLPQKLRIYPQDVEYDDYLGETCLGEC